jgi:uncharacterized protein (DUF983 family)
MIAAHLLSFVDWTDEPIYGTLFLRVMLCVALGVSLDWFASLSLWRLVVIIIRSLIIDILLGQQPIHMIHLTVSLSQSPFEVLHLIE